MGGGPGVGGTKGRELNECIFTNSNWKKVGTPGAKCCGVEFEM